MSVLTEWCLFAAVMRVGLIGHRRWGLIGSVRSGFDSTAECRGGCRGHRRGTAIAAAGTLLVIMIRVSVSIFWHAKTYK